MYRIIVSEKELNKPVYSFPAAPYVTNDEMAIDVCEYTKSALGTLPGGIEFNSDIHQVSFEKLDI